MQLFKNNSIFFIISSRDFSRNFSRGSFKYSSRNFIFFLQKLFLFYFWNSSRVSCKFSLKHYFRKSSRKFSKDSSRSSFRRVSQKFLKYLSRHCNINLSWNSLRSFFGDYCRIFSGSPCGILLESASKITSRFISRCSSEISQEISHEIPEEHCLFL